jgi:TatD DNase family protein
MASLQQKFAINPIIVDSHCHLDLLEAKGFDIDEIIENAAKNDVKFLQTICTKFTEINKIYKYINTYSNIYGSVGIHPNNVDEEPRIKALELIKVCNENAKIIGIGETGLDYHYQSSSKENQKISLLEHIYASQATALPLIIHNRDSDFDMMEILESEQKNKKFPALLHCFSSSEALARKALDLGIFISISGIVTFKNAVDLQNIVKFVPLEFLLVETDSPYLAPVPHRGEVNQPAYTKNVVEFIANLKGVSWQNVAAQTTENFFTLFKKSCIVKTE